MAFRFLDLPPEMRDMVYGHLFTPELNRTKSVLAYITYHYDMSIARTCRQVHDEAMRVFFKLNTFVAIETPWQQAQDHVEREGFVPLLVRDSAAAHAFRHHSLTVAIDAPLYSDSFPADAAQRVVIHADDLATFARFWMYQDLTHPGLNQHMRLTLRLRTPHPRPGEDERAPLPKALQRRLLEPFGAVKNLWGLVVDGEHYGSLERGLRDQMAEPHRAAELCLDEAAARRDRGNDALRAGRFRDAIALYEASFLSLHIVCDGRRRSVFGDAWFNREMLSGRFKGQDGGMQRLMLRVRLVASIVLALLKLGDFAFAKFWGARTIRLFRQEIEADDEAAAAAAADDADDESVLDFPAANDMGRIYYRTGLACKQLGEIVEARRWLKVALAYLPNDPEIRSEYTSVAPRLTG